MIDTKTKPITAPAARYVTLPYLDSADYPKNSPAWFLSALASHADQLCMESTLALRRLSWDLDDVNISAVVVADREGITRETGASGAVNPISAETAEVLEEFLFLHLDQARHEQILTKWEFWQQMACEYLPAAQFDFDRQSQFEARFGEYLDQQPDWFGAKWKASGLSVSGLIAAVLSGEAPSLWHRGTAPTASQDWVSEFESWLGGNGLRWQDMSDKIPGVRADELDEMKARGQRLSTLYLLESDDEDAPVRFVCDDPRTFDRWGATSGLWCRFLQPSDRSAAWAQWTSENAE